MKVKALLILMSLVVLHGCANSGNPRASQERAVDVKVVDSVDSTEAKKDADPNEVICSRRHQVGSNFPRMVCKTRQELEQERSAAERSMNMQQQQNAAGRIDPSRGG